jgi:hypothetical protein
MRSKFWFVSILAAAIPFANVAPALAGTNHAQSTIFLPPATRSVCARDSEVAEAVLTFGNRNRVSHEERFLNYTYGKVGFGHAHHHSGICVGAGLAAGDDKTDSKDAGHADETPPPPILGSKGTSQYIKQTWVPNAAGKKIQVTWTPDSFLQVDPSELTPGSRLVSRASLAADGGLAGTVELSARLNKKGKPQIDTQLTGIFKRAKFELVSHPGGIVSLQFRQPLTWTVRGTAETFDIALEGSIDVGGQQ